MISAALAVDAGYDAWRAVARDLLAAGTRPEDVSWGGGDLFGGEMPARAPALQMSVPRAFVDVAEKAVLHSEPSRFALLYRVLWRLQSTRGLMEDAADADVVALHALAKAVRRDLHKMHAFVRFREIEATDGPRFVSWFEPQYFIEHAVADFFVRRFAGMRWSIFTPRASLQWDGDALAFGPGGSRADVPAEDARDGDWRAYYQSMFNPARLKVAAMTREMPKHYWRNLPEAQDIPALIQAASVRADEMVAAEPSVPRKRAGAAHARIAPEDLPERLAPVAERGEAPATMEDLQRALGACRACSLWCNATQAVPGEGVTEAPLLALVGEQPGDQEDLAGRPFVGPAGKVLDRALAEAGVVRAEIFVTNAVKHFKHEPRGKRRLHMRPDRGEVEICRWWVKHEIELVKPKLVVALGATAVQSLSAYKGALSAVRGVNLETREGRSMRATVHPSYLLRLPDQAAQQAEFERFVDDLKTAKVIASAL